MAKFTPGYYKANNINGVFFYGTLLDDNEAVISPKEFVDSLETLSDDKEIVTYLGEEHEEIFNCVESEYGVLFVSE